MNGYAGTGGFVDVTFVLAGLLGLLALGRNQDEEATLAFALAGALHFRAAVFVPAAALAGVRVLHRAPARALTTLLLASVLVVPTIVAAGMLDRHAFPIHNPLRFVIWRLVLFLLLSAGATGWLARMGHRLSAATLATSAALMLADPQHCWWHALILLVPALTLVTRPTRNGVWVVAWGWCLCAGLLAYRDPAPPFWEWLRLACVIRVEG